MHDGEVAGLCFHTEPHRSGDENQDRAWGTLGGERPSQYRKQSRGHAAHNGNQWQISFRNRVKLASNWGKASANAPLPSQQIERRVLIHGYTP